MNEEGAKQLEVQSLLSMRLERAADLITQMEMASERIDRNVHLLGGEPMLCQPPDDAKSDTRLQDTFLGALDGLLVRLDRVLEITQNADSNLSKTV